MIITSAFLLLASIATSAFAGPLIGARTNYVLSRDMKNTMATITMHSSCNVTAQRQLTKALSDAWDLASTARDYILQNGPEDGLYQMYFGDAEPFTTIGALENLMSGNKTGVLFRCDDPDMNCATQAGWAGHWRGSNATLETVICPLSFQIRKPKEQFCALGYTVAGFNPSYYFGTDLIHRLFHIPTISNGIVDHFADSFEECLELAQEDPEKAGVNTHSIQYFANDVYARTYANPGQGCTGVIPMINSTDHHDHDHGNSTSGKTECHTHANGEVHCG